MPQPSRFWRRLTLSKKLYFVVALLCLLITIELVTLMFAMNILSSLRALVGAEGFWSKAQKDAVISIQNYAISRNPVYYRDFQRYLQVPIGYTAARTSIDRDNPNLNVARRGFFQGRIHPEDIDGVIELAVNFRHMDYLARAFRLWQEGDSNLEKLIAAGEDLHKAITTGGSAYEIREALDRIENLNYDLTRLEDDFSYTLGEGSRWIEKTIKTVVLIAALIVGVIGILLTMSLSRGLRAGLRELTLAAQRVGRGVFHERVPVRSRDELGQLASAINKMANDLEHSAGKTAEAEKANQLKSLFLANMSHEIRTPLGAIVGFVDLLREANHSKEEREQYLNIIHSTAMNLTSIINDILDISKVEAGHLEIEKSPILVSDFLSDIHRMLEFRAKEKNIALFFDLRPSLPKYIYTDALRLRQILMNILGNAIKFTSEGHVKLVAELQGPFIKFLIEDTGIGISSDQVGHLFQTFSQVDNSVTRRFHGTGLGLALSRRLAQLLGGNVALISSSPGRGSTFAVSIRYEEVATGAEPDRSNVVSIDREKVAKKLAGKRILVVEDVEENRFLMQQVLAKRGAQIIEAKDGREGVELALKGDFDLVLMDIQMPILDGYSAVRELRLRGYQAPIIALTAHAMAEDRNKCFAAGFSDYLSKPLQYDRLLGVVAQFL